MVCRTCPGLLGIVQTCDVGRFINDVLYAVHRQRQILGVVCCQSHVDVHKGHDKEGRDCQGPPAIWIIIDPELMQKVGWQIGPENVHHYEISAIVVDLRTYKSDKLKDTVDMRYRTKP